MCINDSGWEETRSYLLGLIKRNKTVEGPSYGDIVTVVGGHWETGRYYYFLKEWPRDLRSGFQADCFVPLSDIDEKEMKRDYAVAK